MYNVFEDVPDRRFSTVSQIKCTMLDCGALSSIMTGTGSAVFGIFDDERAARSAVDALKKDFSVCCLAKNMPRV